jgi:hypothetical protein
MGKLVISLLLFLAAAGPALAQATATKPPVAAPSPSTSPPTTATTPTPSPPSPSAGAPTSQFKTEAAAKEHCPGDTVVWATLTRSRRYHLGGDRYYGKTRRGAYMCRKDADAAGMHLVTRRGRTSSRTAKPSSGGSSTSGSTNQ